MKRLRVPRQNIARPAASMMGRGARLEAHQVVGPHLKSRQIDVEHLLHRRVARQHADHDRRVRLARLNLPDYAAIITFWNLGIAFLMVVVIAASSSYFGVRKVLKIEPFDIFRG